MTWRPIHTAPRDRTRVDLWVQTRKFERRVPSAQWGEGGQFWTDEVGRRLPPDAIATHWMPEPDPPSYETLDESLLK